MEEQKVVQYGTTVIPFSLRRSDRSTLAITVQPDATVHVTAPLHAEWHKIESRVLKRGRWIRKQQQFFETFLPATPVRTYVSGETHFYLGKQYRLKILVGSSPSVKLKSGRLMVTAPDNANTDHVKQLLGAWYKQHAEKRFEQALQQAMPLFRKYPINLPEITVKRMQKRWGSCQPDGRIILNPEIIKAPPRCIDYVVIHELCHLVHHDHGSQFYRLHDKVMPDWRRWKEKLEKVMS